MRYCVLVLLLCVQAFLLPVHQARGDSFYGGEDESRSASDRRHDGPLSLHTWFSMYRVSNPGFRSGAMFQEGFDRRDAKPFDEYDPDSTNIQWGRAAGVAVVLGGVVTAVHIYQRNAWWRNDSCGFHIVPDPDYALNIDKVGHFHGGAFASFLGQKSLVWSGVSRETAVWGGFAMGTLFQLYVEFEDGFGCDWGFSPGDAYADVLGAAWPVAQYYIPELYHVWPKISYWPSKTYADGIHTGNAIDDYNGQTYWMGVHPYSWLPQGWQTYWPSWLGFAVGVAVRNLKTEAPLEQHVYIALDYDMTEILPGDSWFLQTFKEALNFIHFPSPAIRISPSFIGYGLYF